MMMYEVGQVLFVVFKNDKKVVPVQIIEEITRKTLDGLKIDYVLKIGSDKETTILLNEIDGEVFESSEIAVSVLSEKAKKNIIKLVNYVVEKSKQWYKPLQQNRSVQTPVQYHSENLSLEDEVEEQIESKEEEVKVKLPDGSYANLKFPIVA